MKTNTLYVSDLDGTLLASNGTLSEKSTQILNLLIKDGVNFSIATSRNYIAFSERCSAIDFSVPVILNAGACIYDCRRQTYLYTNPIPFRSIFELKKALKDHHLANYLYALKGQTMHLLYDELYCDEDHRYVDSRKEKYHPIHMDSTTLEKSQHEYDPIFLVGYGTLSHVTKMQELGKNIDGIKSIISKDVYSADCYFIEFSETKACKSYAIEKLKEYLTLDEVVVFGDNTNDTDMIKAANRSYVPENGVDVVKKYATDIIECNDTDSVARFIQEDYLGIRDSNLCES